MADTIISGYTPTVHQALVTAVQIAAHSMHPEITPEHLLFGMMSVPGAVSPGLLQASGTNPVQVTRALESYLQKLPSAPIRPGAPGPFPMSPQLTRILSRAAMLSQEAGETTVNESILLQALKEAPSPVWPVQEASQTSAETLPPTLARFGTDLTALARAGKLDPVIGRTAEITRAIEILGRKTKNNPVLIGEPGVGKSAIAEGLAQRIVSGDVPERMRKVQLVELRISGLLGGTGMRGALEERLEKLVQEVEGSEGRIVLFIDELHLIATGGRAEGAMEMAQILKPALARGQMRVLGATTRADWKRSLDRDAALARRLQQVPVDEPSLEDTLKILQGVRASYEAHHQVQIPDTALTEAVRIGDRFLRDRSFPDKALDLLDEAASKTRMRSTEALPPVLPLSIADVASTITGIPVGVSGQSDPVAFNALSARLKAQVIGQDTPIDTVVAAVRRHRAGIADPDRPAGVFLLAGPTGVGKTAFAQALARELFGPDRRHFTKINLSEFQERHSVARFIGSPAGYVGHDDGGMLVEQVRAQPYQVLLLDEMEKAHPDIFNLFLQVFDDGELIDGRGNRASFRDVIILMTTNMGTSDPHAAPIGFGATETTPEERVAEAVKETLKPELRNRLDGVLVFNRLTPDSMPRVVDVQMRRVEEVVAKSRRVQVEVSPEARSWLAERGYDKVYGARPLKRLIDTSILNPVADLLLEGGIQEGGTVHVGLRDGKISVG